MLTTLNCLGMPLFTEIFSFLNKKGSFLVLNESSSSVFDDVIELQSAIFVKAWELACKHLNVTPVDVSRDISQGTKAVRHKANYSSVASVAALDGYLQINLAFEEKDSILNKNKFKIDVFQHSQVNIKTSKTLICCFFKILAQLKGSLMQRTRWKYFSQVARQFKTFALLMYRLTQASVFQRAVPGLNFSVKFYAQLSDSNYDTFLEWIDNYTANVYRLVLKQDSSGIRLLFGLLINNEIKYQDLGLFQYTAGYIKKLVIKIDALLMCEAAP